MMKVGIDVLDVERMNKILKKNDHLQQIFSENELNYYKGKNNYLPTLAGMYCAKEAFLKALSIGVRNGVSFLEIEVDHEESGNPVYKLSSHIRDILKSLKIVDVELSISHTDTFATAICIMN